MSSTGLRITLACASYENRNEFLFDGTINPEGIDLVKTKFSDVDELFREVLHNKKFDACELSLSNYIYARDMYDLEYIAIPVFLSRRFRHQDIFVSTKSGIRSPSDLIGRKVVSSPSYYVTASIWQRGILQHEFGVDPSKVQWFVEKEERIPISFPKGVSPKLIEDPWNELAKGNIDAAIGPRRHPNHPYTTDVKRLFEDPISTETEYYRRTKIYPIMHALVIKKSILDRNPWVATNLIEAFSHSKKLWQEGMHGRVHPLRLAGPAWADIMIEQERKLLGDDSYPYGIRENRKTIHTLIQYCAEQAVLKKEPPTVEELFAENTLEISA
jgi:4,5-dihydroxyphthalate decarboxylase